MLRMSLWRTLVAVFLATVPNAVEARDLSAPGSPVGPARAETGSDVLAVVRPSVVQINGLLGTNTVKAFHGTGFAVGEGGVFATNYHVVAEQIQHPDKYRLEYTTDDGRSGAISIIAVDVRHDLAIVRANGYAPPPLKLATMPPAKGDRAYSVGFPLDVGLTITEGISNGLLDDTFNKLIHYSGAINAGMSGGPALNALGEVIGVNVSGYRFAQLVTFLVPVEHLRVLRNKASDRGSGSDDLNARIHDQIRAHSHELLSALGGPLLTQSTSGYALPARIAPFIDCNATGEPEPREFVQTVKIACAAKAGLYLQQGLYTGDLKYSHTVLSTQTLDAWRFAKRLSTRDKFGDIYGSRRHVAPFSCKDRVLALKGFDARVLVCTRGYRRLEHLYDFVIRVASLNGAHAGLTSQLEMYGFEFDAGMGFIRRYVDAMEWKI
jgi:serine protease Do